LRKHSDYAMSLIKVLDILGPLLALSFLLARRERAFEGKLVMLFLAIQVILNSIAKYIMKLGPGHNNNLLYYKLNAFLSFAIVGWFFLVVFRKILNAAMYKSAFAYYLSVLLILVFVLPNESTSSFNSISFSITAFSICLFCIVYYLFNLINPGEQNIIQTRRFWFITAFFVYYGSDFFIFLTYRVLAPLLIGGIGLWGVHNIILFISCCIILTAAKWKET
jgi:hypothetical protein